MALRRRAQLADNPKRPPKHWWKGCVRGVRDSGSAAEPERVCGSIWYHQMSSAQRKRVLKQREGKMFENPSPKLKSGYSYVLTGNRRGSTGVRPDWRREPDDLWETELRRTPTRAYSYLGQRRIDGVTVNVWFVPGRTADDFDEYVAQTALGEGRKRNMNANPSRITVTDRPYTLTFLATGASYPLTSKEAQRLLDEYPAVKASKNRVVLQGHNTSDPRQRTVLTPATRGGGSAFFRGSRNMNANNPCKTGSCIPTTTELMFSPGLNSNPNGGGLLLLAGGALLVGYLLLRPKTAAAATTAPPLGASCTVTTADLDAWGQVRGVPVIRVQATELTPATVSAMPGVSDMLAAGDVPVFVLADGSFWTLTFNPATSSWFPAPAPAQRQDYCEWIAAGKPQTGLPPGGPASCPLAQGALNAWGAARSYSVILIPSGTAPLNTAQVSTIPTLPQIVASGNVPVIVLGDGSFWTVTFDQVTGMWLPAPAPAQKDDYCVFFQSWTPPPPPPVQAPGPVINPATSFNPITFT